MNIAYLTYHQRRNLPQVQCLIASIRRFDQDAYICSVVDDDCFRESIDAYGDDAEVILMSRAEKECREMGLDWGSVRGSRSERDVAWTFQSCYPCWFMKGCRFDEFVYCDSDVFHFQDLRPYIDRLPETAHVALCDHHYPPGKENKSAGVYNNGIMWWRNSDVAREIAYDWGKEAIAVWRPHEQILLDAWPERYGEAVAEFPRDVDYGPWQLSKIVSMNGHPMLDYGLTLGPIQSTHMHEFRIDATGNNPVTIKGRQCNRTNYALHPATIESVYRPYEKMLEEFL